MSHGRRSSVRIRRFARLFIFFSPRVRSFHSITEALCRAHYSLPLPRFFFFSSNYFRHESFAFTATENCRSLRYMARFCSRADRMGIRRRYLTGRLGSRVSARYRWDRPERKKHETAGREEAKEESKLEERRTGSAGGRSCEGGLERKYATGRERELDRVRERERENAEERL